MPAEVITRIHTLARRNPSGLTFYDRNGNMYDLADNDTVNKDAANDNDDLDYDLSTDATSSVNKPLDEELTAADVRTAGVDPPHDVVPTINTNPAGYYEPNKAPVKAPKSAATADKPSATPGVDEIDPPMTAGVNNPAPPAHEAPDMDMIMYKALC
eukprot:8308460-Ditylum_brightwellii.AAC.1